MSRLRDKIKPRLEGMHPFYGPYYGISLFIWLVSEILTAGDIFITPGLLICFWGLLLVVEASGIVRKSGRIGGTLSEFLWWISKNYSSRRWMTAILGIGIGFRGFLSFGFANWRGDSDYGVFKYDLFNYGGLVIWSVAFIVWIVPHFLYSGKRG